MTNIDIEATLEVVLPVVVTDVMHLVEERGGHPEEKFADVVRDALREVIPKHPTIEDDIWDPEKKKEILEEIYSNLKM